MKRRRRMRRRLALDRLEDRQLLATLEAGWTAGGDGLNFFDPGNWSTASAPINGGGNDYDIEFNGVNGAVVFAPPPGPAGGPVPTSNRIDVKGGAGVALGLTVSYAPNSGTSPTVSVESGSFSLSNMDGTQLITNGVSASDADSAEIELDHGAWNNSGAFRLATGLDHVGDLRLKNNSVLATNQFFAGVNGLSSVELDDSLIATGVTTLGELGGVDLDANNDSELTANTLTITHADADFDASILNVGTRLEIADVADVTGAVTLSNESEGEVSGVMVIGKTGIGAVHVKQGSVLEVTGSVTLGETATATGELKISEPAVDDDGLFVVSKVTMNDETVVGQEGDGYITVEYDGILETNGEVSGAIESGSNATIELNDGRWDAIADVWLDSFSAGSTQLTITSGGKFNGTALLETAATTQISGANSSASAETVFVRGDTDVYSFGKLISDGTLEVSTFDPSDAGHLSIKDIGSKMESGELIVSGGHGATVVISNSADADMSGNIVIAKVADPIFEPAQSGKIEVDGSTISGNNITVGKGGTGEISFKNGSTGTFRGNLVVADSTASEGDVLIEGISTTVTAGETTIGNKAKGTLKIEEGVLHSTQGYIAKDAGSDDSDATVDGGIWMLSSSLHVGNGAGKGSLTLDNYALVSAENGVVENEVNGTVQGGNGARIKTVTFGNKGVIIVGFSPGELQVEGNFEQSTTGILEMEVGGSTAGVDYDLLDIIGDATLGGTLTVSGGGSVGDYFDIVTADSISGEFSTLDLPTLGTGLAWQVTYDDADGDGRDQVRLTVVPKMTVSPPSFNEENLAVDFVIEVAEPTTETIQLKYQTEDNTAAAPGNRATMDEDYNYQNHTSESTGILEIPAGESSWTVSIAVNDDYKPENDETFLVRFYEPRNGFFEYHSDFGEPIAEDRDDDELSVVGTILDTDVVYVNIDDSPGGSEGDLPAEAVFTVSLANADGDPITLSDDVDIHFVTADGTADAGDDFTGYTPASPGSVTIPAGEPSADFSIAITNDPKDEPDEETFQVTISSPDDVDIPDPVAQATIYDDDEPPVLTIADTSVAEDIASGVATLTVTLSEVSGKDITVYYETQEDLGGSYAATAGTDFAEIQSDFVIIPAGASSATIEAQILDDSLDEYDEPFQVVLTGADNATVYDADVLVTILDNDMPPTLVIADQSGSEYDYIFFPLTLSAPSGKKITAEVDVNAGTGTYPAVFGEDYYDADDSDGSIEVIFPPGEIVQTAEVSLSYDGVYELDQYFLAQVVSSTNVTVGDGQATGTIYNTDPLPDISISDTTVIEGESSAEFLIDVNGLFEDINVSVDYYTSDGTATAGDDFTGIPDTAPQTVTFTPEDAENNPTKTISISVADDGIEDDNETFYVDLTNQNPAGVSLGTGFATGWINDPEYLTLALPADESSRQAEVLTLEAAQPLLEEAFARWEAAGADAKTLRKIEQGLTVAITDLEGSRLAAAGGPRIVIDADAAGYGWFVDQTPSKDEEFRRRIAPTQRQAAGDSAAAGRVDLLTTLMHEVGHLLGWPDLSAETTPHHVMTRTIGLGVRRLLGEGDGATKRFASPVEAAYQPAHPGSPQASPVDATAGDRLFKVDDNFWSVGDERELSPRQLRAFGDAEFASALDAILTGSLESR